MPFLSFGKKKKKLELSAQKVQQRLGQKCKSCQQTLKESDCISICGCYYFCHEQCFVKQISPFLSENTSALCVRCGQPIRFTMKKSVYWTCNKSPSYLLSIIAGIICLIGMYVLIEDGAYRILFSDQVGYIIVSVGAVLFLGVILKSMRRKIIRIEDIKVQNTHVLSTGQSSQELVKKYEEMDSQGTLEHQKKLLTHSKLHSESRVEIYPDTQTL